MAETSKMWSADNPRSDDPFDPRLLVAVLVVVPTIILVLALMLYRVAYDGRIYLGVTAGNVDLQGYTPSEARSTLVARFQRYSTTPLALRFEQQEWRASPAEMGMRFDVDGTIDSAYAVGREGGMIDQLTAQVLAWRRGEVAKRAVFRLDVEQRDRFFDRLAKQVYRQPVDARLSLVKNEFGTRLSPSQAGRALNVEKTAGRIEAAIAAESAAPIDVVVDVLPPTTTEADLRPTKDLAERMMSSAIVARFEEQSWRIEREDIAELLSLRDQPAANPKVAIDVAEQPLQRLAMRAAKAIDRRPLNARFDYAAGNLKVIRDGVDGRNVDVAAAVGAIKQQLASDERSFTLPVKVTKPSFGSTDGAKLTIAGVVEEAKTSYAGTAPERVYNVELAASRLHGVAVAPGQVFSFNDEVGPVNTLSGYKIGFGITQEGGNAITVPSVGGGICQVATTLFHPVFWAGYEIGDRVPHLYWIPRYGVPPKGMTGLDTTVDQIYDKEGNLVYAVDFTFKNNSPNPILIQSKTDGKDITFSILGVKPTWEVKAEGPFIDNVVPKINETVRQEDPTMPVGRSIVIEEARDGFKSVIVRTVTQDGKTVDRHTFTSRYQPTRNVILVGTQAPPVPVATATPSGATTPGASPSPAKTPPASTTPGTTPVPTPATTPARR